MKRRARMRQAGRCGEGREREGTEGVGERGQARGGREGKEGEGGPRGQDWDFGRRGREGRKGKEGRLGAQGRGERARKGRGQGRGAEGEESLARLCLRRHASVMGPVAVPSQAVRAAGRGGLGATSVGAGVCVRRLQPGGGAWWRRSSFSGDSEPHGQTRRRCHFGGVGRGDGQAPPLGGSGHQTFTRTRWAHLVKESVELNQCVNSERKFHASVWHVMKHL